MSKRYATKELEGFAKFYDEHGVVKLPGLVEQVWVEKLLREIDDAAALVDKRPEGSVVTYGKGEGRLTIRWLWRESELLRSFLLRPELAEIVAKVIRTKQLRYWYDNTFMHLGGPDGAGTPWHHDVAAFPLKGCQNPSLWIALTAANERSATLRIVDGSHRDRAQYRPPPLPGAAPTPLEEGFEDLPDIDARIAAGQSKVLSWDVQPGDALLIHPYALHGAKANEIAGNRRISFTTRWAGDDVHWAPDRYSMKVPGLDISKIARGDRPDGDLFPLVWDEQGH